jgi:hypothetical protein
MPSQPSYQDTNISLKTGFKNIRRSTPFGDQNHPPGTREEVSNQTINFEMDFIILATQFKEIKLTNMSSATKEYIIGKQWHLSKTSETTSSNNNKYSTTGRNNVVPLLNFYCYYGAGVQVCDRRPSVRRVIWPTLYQHTTTCLGYRMVCYQRPAPVLSILPYTLQR